MTDQGAGAEEDQPRDPDQPTEVPAPGQLSPDQPPPSPRDSFEAGPTPMHPALQPRGEHVAHSAIGSLVGGVLVWGGVGLLLDRWLDTGRALTAVGIVVGFLTGFLIVYVRFGRDE